MFEYPEKSFRSNEGISKSLLLASIPIILLFSALSGSIGFMLGHNESQASVHRKSQLPEAGNRVIVYPQYNYSFLSNLVNSLNVVSAMSFTKDGGDWIRIPALKINAPLNSAVSMSDADVLKTLSKGVALYPNGVKPGQQGKVFISGHSTGEPWKGIYRFVFMHLNELKPGDEIIIDFDSTRYSYRVTKSSIIDPSNLKFISSDNSKPVLSLMACWPLWTTKNRIIVDAQLIKSSPLIVSSQV